MSSGQPLLEAKLDVSGFVQETGKIQLHSEQDLEDLKQLSETLLARRLEAVITSTQTINSDVIGFGEYLRRRYPKTWKGLEWDNIFPETLIKVEVRVRLNVSWPEV